MLSINRVAIVVRPKPPFFDWARNLPGGLPQGTDQWSSVYLVEASENAEPQKLIRRHFAAVFDEQLESWHRLIDDWPTPRTFALFQRWFEVEVVDLILDLSESRINHEDVG